jgi:hypothetical protein
METLTEIAAVEGWDAPEALDNFERPDFPTDALPGVLADFVRALAVETGTYEDMAGMLPLAAVAAVLAHKVEVRRPWREPVNLYVCVAMPSGERKSPVFTKVFGPIEALEERLAAETSSERTRAKAEREWLIKSNGAQASACLRANDRVGYEDAMREELIAKTIPVPAPPRLLASDVTPEKIPGLLAEQGGRIAITSDVGGIFDTIAGRYASQVPNLDAVLKSHDGSSPIRVDRVGRESEYVKNPAITFGLAVQPEVLQKIGDNRDFKGRGFSARFLWAVPGSIIGWRPVAVKTVPDAVRNAYWQLLLGPLHGVDNLRLDLDEDALDLFNSWREMIEVRLRPDGDLAPIQAWANKHAGAVLRIAAILHVVENGGLPGEAISADTLQRALAFSEYLIAHARIALDALGMRDEHTVARRALAWIKAKGELSFMQRDACRDLHMDVERLTTGLEVLIAKGFVRREVVEQTSGNNGGGRTSLRYDVYPGLVTKEQV